MAAGTVKRLAALLDEMIEEDPARLGDGEGIVALHRQLERLAAVTTRATAAFDASGGWENDGAASASASLATRLHLPLSTARHRVGLGRALRHMAPTEAAWMTGEVGHAQVSRLARARTPATEEALARDEELLVGYARDMRFGAFGRALAYWCLCADPQGAEGDARAQREGRRLHLSQSWDGRWFLDAVLDPIDGAVVDAELRHITDELLAADRAEARARVGPGGTDLARTCAQRRPDALVEMATRSATAPPGGRRPEPLLTVLVGYETLAGVICELANGTMVTPGSVLRLLDRAWVERVVFDGPARVIDVGVRQRLFGGATRRAVQVRDRECFHPFCDRGAEDCDIDHIEPYAEGGLTIAANGRPACAFHNRHRHRRP